MSYMWLVMVFGTRGWGGGIELRIASNVGDSGTPSDSFSNQSSYRIGYWSFLVFLFLLESTLSISPLSWWIWHNTSLQVNSLLELLCSPVHDSPALLFPVDVFCPPPLFLFNLISSVLLCPLPHSYPIRVYSPLLLSTLSFPSISILTASEIRRVSAVLRNFKGLKWNEGSLSPPWWGWWCLYMWESSCLFLKSLHCSPPRS